RGNDRVRTLLWLLCDTPATIRARRQRFNPLAEIRGFVMANQNRSGRCAWGVALVVTALAAVSCQTHAAEPTLTEQIRQAERILVVAPEKDIDVPGGEQYLV